MTRNHLPEDVDLEGFATDSFSETSYAGIGFGLGFSVVIDSVEEPEPRVGRKFRLGRRRVDRFSGSIRRRI